MSEIYRGFDIEQVNGGYWISRDGKTPLGGVPAKTYDDAIALIDKIKSEEFKAKVDVEESK